MPSLVIKKLPEELHRSLKEQAARNHRSMTREAVAILSQGLDREAPAKLPKPYKGAFPLTNDFINTAKHEGRE